MAIAVVLQPILQMRRRRLERLSNLPLRSNTAPTQGAEAADTSAAMNESLSASVPDIVYTAGEVGAGV